MRVDGETGPVEAEEEDASGGFGADAWIGEEVGEYGACGGGGEVLQGEEGVIGGVWGVGGFGFGGLDVTIVFGQIIHVIIIIIIVIIESTLPIPTSISIPIPIPNSAPPPSPPILRHNSLQNRLDRGTLPTRQPPTPNSINQPALTPVMHRKPIHTAASRTGRCHAVCADQ